MQSNSHSHRDCGDKKVVPAHEGGDIHPGSRGFRAECHLIDDPVPADVKSKLTQETILGVVTDCIRLNIRKQPDANAGVVAVIDLLTEVTVDLSASTGDFYKICTVEGVEGFCMKKYIALPR